MKRVQYDRYGGPEHMRLADFQLATPVKDQVAVKVKFAAINPIDWKVRNGDLKMVTGRSFPKAMGSDFSGTVVAVGPDVTRFKPGDAVFGMASIRTGGAVAQGVITTEALLAKKPDAVPFEQAACVGTPGVTAWNGLVDKARLTHGMSVFVNGCAGAVGEAAVQLAKMSGATVAGSCSASKIGFAHFLGVDPVYDYRETDIAALNERFDVVFDTSAAMPVTEGFRLLRRRGVFLDIAPTGSKFLRAMLDRRLKPIVCTASSDILNSLALAAEAGKLRFRIAEIVPLNQAIELINTIESGRMFGGKGLVSMN